MLVYLNGDWIPAEEARVSVFDRGFIFGDSVYEVIPVYGHRPFRARAHIERLKICLNEVGMNKQDLGIDWATFLDRLVETLPSGDGSIYVQITRGTAPRQHGFPSNAPLTVFAYARPKPAGSTNPASSGIKAILLDDMRWSRCDIKSTSLIANVLLVEKALQQGAEEALLVRDGFVYEGAVSNLFIVKSGALITAPRSHLILSGITRDVVLELAVSRNIAVTQRAPTTDELLTADEVLITSSTREITPVTLVNAQKVGDGAPGPVFHDLYTAFQGFKDDVRKGISK